MASLDRWKEFSDQELQALQEFITAAGYRKLVAGVEWKATDQLASQLFREVSDELARRAKRKNPFQYARGPKRGANLPPRPKE